MLLQSFFGRVIAPGNDRRNGSLVGIASLRIKSLMRNARD